MSDNDYLSGGGDNTILYGGAGNDSLSGTGDVLEVGGAGNDWLTVGKTGDGTLFGGVGDDTLDDYSVGNNHLLGGRGNDILIGFRGYDTLTGGLGADIFQVFDSSLSFNDGYTTVTDFRHAQGDKIQVYGSASNYSLLATATTDTSLIGSAYQMEFIVVIIVLFVCYKIIRFVANCLSPFLEQEACVVKKRRGWFSHGLQSITVYYVTFKILDGTH